MVESRADTDIHCEAGTLMGDIYAFLLSGDVPEGMHEALFTD